MKLLHLLTSAVLVFSALPISQFASAEPIVIAHRGASGYLPEHTLEAASLAHALGSDYIEQDLVLSRDGIPVVLHDIHLDTTTNVRQVFPDRHRSDGRYYVIDFTISELKQLTVHERRNLKGKQVFANRYKGSAKFTIATFAEQVELIQNLNRTRGKEVGFYPEIKAPGWHRDQGYDISKIVMAELRAHNLDHKNAMVYLQCFDFSEIKRIHDEFSPRVPLIQLIGARSQTPEDKFLKSAAGIETLRRYVAGVGPAVPLLFEIEGQQIVPSKFMATLKRNGLEVHPYTHRSDQLPEGVTNEAHLSTIFRVGATGVFTDFPDQVRQYLDTPR